MLVTAKLTGLELARRRIALGLLTALPLAFYGGSVGRGSGAVITGGVAMAFSIAGASIFVALTARPVDPRLILAGYHPTELLLGRLLLLELFGLLVTGVFSVVMVFGSDPAHPWAMVGGVALVALTSVPFGLAVGALSPHELEGVLVLIGVVGVQLTLFSTDLAAHFLPFWGGQRLLDHSVNPVAAGAAVPGNVAYAAALFAIAAYVMRRQAPRVGGA
ncbi:MAG TPA: hypothetical protein VL977_08530, partial [Solirubrobacteraceae bacterium]|nr:hypothetical protein [Solirubrobacteraceae bacterium]